MPKASTRLTQSCEHPFRFTGNPSGNLRIRIVNLALGIVTLSVYPAWARVRAKRCVHANTRVAGTPFQYRARPAPLLPNNAPGFHPGSRRVCSLDARVRIEIPRALFDALTGSPEIFRALSH